MEIVFAVLERTPSGSLDVATTMSALTLLHRSVVRRSLTLRNAFLSERFNTTILSCLAQTGAKHLQDEGPFHDQASRHVCPLQQHAERYLSLDLWSTDITSTLLSKEDIEHLANHQGISCAADATLFILGNERARRSWMTHVGYFHSTRAASHAPDNSVNTITQVRHLAGPHPSLRPEFLVVGSGCWPVEAGDLIPDYSLPATPWQMHRMKVPLCLELSSTFLTIDDKPVEYSPNDLVAVIIINDGHGHVAIDRIRSRTSVTEWATDLWAIHDTPCFGKDGKKGSTETPDDHRACKGRRISPATTPAQAERPEEAHRTNSDPLIPPLTAVDGQSLDDTQTGKKSKQDYGSNEQGSRAPPPIEKDATTGASSSKDHKRQCAPRVTNSPANSTHTVTWN